MSLYHYPYKLWAILKMVWLNILKVILVVISTKNNSPKAKLPILTKEVYNEKLHFLSSAMILTCLRI